jgi:tetratricopeptide (TPR) repeat protein
MNEQELKRQVSEALAKREFVLAERLCQQAEGSIAAAELFLIRGALYSAQGDLDNARSALARAHQALPERGDIAYNYGVVLQQSGRIAEAVEAWKTSTSCAPQNPAAWVNLALAILQLGDAPAALATYRRGLKYHPTHRDLLYNYANLLFRQGQLEKGESAYQKLLKFHRSDAQAWINYGKLLKTARRFAESEACCRQAIALAHPADLPQAHFNLANLLLQQGKWQEGFAAYQWRLTLPGSISSPWGLPEWKPALPKGSRVLLWNDQGQGDAIMFLRFAALFAQQGYRLFAFVQNSLKELAATAPGIEAAYCLLDAPQALDANLPLCSLPHALGLASVDVWQGPMCRRRKPPSSRLPNGRPRASASASCGPAIPSTSTMPIAASSLRNLRRCSNCRGSNGIACRSATALPSLRHRPIASVCATLRPIWWIFPRRHPCCRSSIC